MSTSSCKHPPRFAEWADPGLLPDIPNDINFAAFVMDKIANYGDAVAIINAETGEKRTYEYLNEYVPRVAGGLRVAGVKKGDIVLYVSPNHVDYPLMLLSVVYSGAIFAPINDEITHENMVHVIRNSGTRWIISHQSSLQKVEEAVSQLPAGIIKQTWVLDEEYDDNSIFSLLNGPPIDPARVDGDLHLQKTAAIVLYSSGTTGSVSKGVVKSHSNVLLNQFIAKYCAGLTNKSQANVQVHPLARALIACQMHGLLGFNIVSSTLVIGGTSIFMSTSSEFNESQFFEAVQEYKVTGSPLFSRLVDIIANSSLLKEYDISSVLYYSWSVSPLGQDVVKKFEERIGKKIYGGYGSTETGVVSMEGGIAGYRAGSCGQIRPFYKVKVIDLDTKEILGENQKGEICVLSPGNMIGYLNDPSLTRDVMDNEGWIHTGDLGYFDEDNFLYVIDRVKDLIEVHGSHKVSPSELEFLIKSHEEVRDVAVVGVPNEETGEAPRAYVVPVPGAKIQPTDVQKYVRERVPVYKRLKGGVAFVESIPWNHLGKILRKNLKEEFLASCIDKLELSSYLSRSS